MLKRKLLTLLFICTLLPVLVTLFQSSYALVAQKKTTTDISGRYVRNLAAYAALCWNEGNPDRIGTFLSLVADQGYDLLIAPGDIDPAKLGKDVRHKISMRGKFVPGMVAYVTADGKLVSASQNASVLQNVFDKAVNKASGVAIGEEGHIWGAFRAGNEDVSYVAYISRTKDPRVYAVAAVTMLSWMGKNDFDMMRLAIAGTLGMLACLVALFLLRGSVILPLQSLASLVGSLRWGHERAPETPDTPTDIHVEEITSLRNAVSDLAERMIEKNELETRYVGDIIKAQEAERKRIAQDIHDGPIQVVSALIQRMQIVGITTENLSRETRHQLQATEDIASDLVEDLRDICDSLLPPWVSLGLPSCLEESAHRFSRQHDLQIHTTVDPTIEVGQDATLALYRIFQEAVSNAARHGKASEVDLEAAFTETGEVCITIADNGVGFTPHPEMNSELMKDGKRGLNGMRQRIELLGGTYCVHSAPGEGTKIVVCLPLREAVD